MILANCFVRSHLPQATHLRAAGVKFRLYFTRHMKKLKLLLIFGLVFNTGLGGLCLMSMTPALAESVDHNHHGTTAGVAMQSMHTNECPDCQQSTEHQPAHTKKADCAGDCLAKASNVRATIISLQSVSIDAAVAEPKTKVAVYNTGYAVGLPAATSTLRAQQFGNPVLRL
jgi:hypothetical protein